MDMERKLRKRKKHSVKGSQSKLTTFFLYPWRFFMKLSKRTRIALVVIPVCIVLFVIPMVTYLYYANDISDRERLMNRNNTGVVVMDRDGGVLYSTGRAEKRQFIELSNVPVYLKQALIATEDKDFYQHGGFNLLSIGRALVTNISAGDATAYGGSTLTQQLAKNTLLSENKSFFRKYQELAVSVAIEQQYTKDEILAMYLNSVYYGENAFGIEEAARVYYGKKPNELSLAESAMLIGILPAPSLYSPISGSMEYAKQRQALVLDRMKTSGAISAEQVAAAQEEKITYAPASDKESRAPHFVQMVLQKLAAKYGDEAAQRSGYRVTTTLDPKVQKVAVDSVQRHLSMIQANGGSNASVVVLDPSTGEIRALVGSADWQNKTWGKVDMTTTPRQPGSSFKPIYITGALESGVVMPSTVIKDVPTNFGGYTPKNADKRFRGALSLRSALSQSLNIPSIKVMERYGISRSVQYAKKLDIPIDDSKQYGLSLALGSSEVDLLHMTNAYAAFAHQGGQYSTSSIQYIKDRYGNEVLRNNPSRKQVVSEEAAYLISSMLSDDNARRPVFGRSLTLNAASAAVKTGTTDDSRDAWTIGYTPKLVTGVWVGNNDNQAMRRGGAALAGPIWKDIMNASLERQQGEVFTRPSGVIARDTCRTNGGIVVNGVKTDDVYSEVYSSIHLPTETCSPKKIVEIEVCSISSGEVVTIDEETFDAAKYIKDIKQCALVKMCNITSGERVEILRKDVDESIHSEPRADGTCTAVPEIKEDDGEIEESQPNDNPGVETGVDAGETGGTQ